MLREMPCAAIAQAIGEPTPKEGARDYESEAAQASRGDLSSRGRTRGVVTPKTWHSRWKRDGADLAVAGANFLTRNEGQIHRHLPSPGDSR